MNKNAIQKFAIWARNELITQVSQRAYQYGIDESGFGDASADTLNGRLLTAEEKSQRQELIKQIKEKGYKQVMEEVAYTWFNRFIALRFMEVNNYLPSHIRVFSDASGAFKPEILNDVLHLDLPGLDSGKVAEYIESNDTEALYRYLLLTQCNALNSALPIMFERMGGYTEMLLPNNILRQDSVLGHMVSDIPEEDWQDAVQIIGWLYQYYNTELKDDTFAQLKKNVKITKERIPAATQLFTPDWIVRYMVENSLGRLWLEGHPNAELHDGWKYYLDEAKQEPEVEAQLAKLREEYKTIKPEEIKVIDPCMGSGHILVYAFDVLMQIYTSAGWDQREAAQSILKNNLFGLDIDDRAAQLAYFAVMMKARQHDRRLLTRRIQPNIYSIRESNGIQAMTIEYFHKNDPKLKADIESLVTEMRDAKEYGSILNITPVDFAGLYARFDEIRNDINMMQMSALDELLPLVKCAELLAQKYDVVVTNPPYMTISNASPKLGEYVKTIFGDSKADLYSVFLSRCTKMTKENRFQAMITQHSWMYLASFEKMRISLLKSQGIINMAHLGSRAFDEIGGEVVQTTSFVLIHASLNGYLGTYCRLTAPTCQKDKETLFLSKTGQYVANQQQFILIPGAPIAYWLSDAFLGAFNYPPLSSVGETREGITTANNDLFLKLWHEVSIRNIDFNCTSQTDAEKSKKRWFPHHKGGEYRKWFGNCEYVINWEYGGSAIMNYKDETTGRIRSHNYNIEYNFREYATWSRISSENVGLRYSPVGYIFDSASAGLFLPHDLLFYGMGFICSNVAKPLLNVLNPTIKIQPGDVAVLPLKIDQSKKENVDCYVRDCIQNAQEDWNAYETAWDFKRNPLV